MNKIALSFLVMLVVALTGCDQIKWKSSGKKKPKIVVQKASKDAIEFSVPSARSEDTTISLKEYAGQVVLLDFWATWDLPCRAEFPVINELAQEYKAQGFSVLGLIIDTDNTEGVRAFLKENNPDFVNGLAEALLIQEPFTTVRVIPTKYLLNRNHQIVGKPITGIVSESELRERIESLLK